MHTHRSATVEPKWTDSGFGSKDIGEIIFRDERTTSARYTWWISNDFAVSQQAIGYEDSIKR